MRCYPRNAHLRQSATSANGCGSAASPASFAASSSGTTLNLSGFKRAKRLGTFTISSLGNLGVEQHHPISPLTTYLTFGPISASGEVNVKIIYDHRVMDGRTVAVA